MSKRQSRSAEFIGVFWNLGKNQEDPRATHARALQHLERWVTSLSRDSVRSETLARSIAARVAQMRGERRVHERQALSALIRADHTRRTELATRMQQTIDKIAKVMSRERVSTKDNREAPLRAEGRAACRRATPLLFVTPLPKVAAPPTKPPAMHAGSKRPRSPVWTDPPQRATAFGAALLAAVEQRQQRPESDHAARNAKKPASIRMPETVTAKGRSRVSK